MFDHGSILASPVVFLGRDSAGQSPRSPQFEGFSGMSLSHHTPQPAFGLPRHDWTRAEVRALFELSFPELMFQAAQVHRQNFDPAEVQISTLLSIKTGGCPEDCAYCPQAARYD